MPAMFLTLVEKLSVFPHWGWYSLWVFHRWLWWYWGIYPLSLHFEEFWSRKDAVLCQMLFQHLLRVSYQQVLVLSFINVLYHIDWFVNVEPTLQPWNKSHLVVVNNPFNVLLDHICQYFSENFRICVHQGYWSVTLFFDGILVWFLDQGDAGLIKWV